MTGYGGSGMMRRCSCDSSCGRLDYLLLICANSTGSKEFVEVLGAYPEYDIASLDCSTSSTYPVYPTSTLTSNLAVLHKIVKVTPSQTMPKHNSAREVGCIAFLAGCVFKSAHAGRQFRLFPE